MFRYKRVSAMDQKHLILIRTNVSAFLRRVARRHDREGYLLDIGPQDHEGATPYFKRAHIHTLDINPQSGATYIADICQTNAGILPDGFYDFVVCTEVLEHTLQPFRAVEEMHRILIKNGLLFLSVPFNFRIHGPLPDCWRFTEYGLRGLLEQFKIIEIKEIKTPGRVLMPIHYTVIAQKKEAKKGVGRSS